METKIGNLTLVSLSEALIPTVLAITDRHLGSGLYTAEELKRIIGLPHHYFSVVLDGDTAAGVFYCEAGSADELKRDQHWFPYDRPGRYGILRTIAIEDAYREQGLANRLIEHYTALLFEVENVQRIAVLAWMQHDFVPAAVCLMHCGYGKGQLIERPWYDTVGLKCPYCGEERCICDGLLFEKAKEG